MTAAWPELDELIRELAEVAALPRADGEPTFADATIAVTKATTALTRASQARGRASEAARSQALKTVEEARALLRQARLAISAATARQRRERAAAPPSPSGDVVEGETEATCSGCGVAFLVRYRAAAGAAVVTFPVACPAPDCDGVSEVQYPASSVDVSVEPLSAR